MKKQIMAALLCLCLVFALLPSVALAKAPDLSGYTGGYGWRS